MHFEFSFKYSLFYLRIYFLVDVEIWSIVTTFDYKWLVQNSQVKSYYWVKIEIVNL
jgi:hypothetical protein